MADHLDSKNLVPFKRKTNGYRLPLLGKEREQEIIDQVDPDLRPEEQGYVRHYLAYADTLLKSVKEEAPEVETAGDVEAAGVAGEIPAEKNSADVSEAPPEKERKKDIA